MLRGRRERGKMSRGRRDAEGKEGGRDERKEGGRER